ncbi:hypothetical protein G6F31_016131 [Rhizopus arrhizus]|nr:hypothetical protein G6F31_016131 [Rhizopus arrhizus]
MTERGIPSVPPRADHHQQRTPVVLEHFGHRHLDLGAFFPHLLEVGRLGHLDADEPTHQQQHHAGQERQAPAPGQHVLFGQRGHGAHRQRRQDQPGRHARLRQAAEKALLAIGRMLHRHQHCAAPFAAHSNALQKAHEHQQHGGPIADLLIRRDQPDEDGGHAHQQQGDQQHGLAADLVSIVAENHAAQGPREEPHGIRGKRRQRACERVEGGKEDLVEDQCGSRAVQEKVVPLDRGAHHAGKASRHIIAARARSSRLGRHHRDSP